VLVACEFSGTVRDAFTSRGWHAWSCDLLPAETPGHHYQGDVRDLLEGWEPARWTAECDPEGAGWCQVSDNDPGSCQCLGPTMDEDGVEYRTVNGQLFGRYTARPHWDLIIAHPPCTYLCSSGLHWNTRVPGRAEKTEESLVFVQELLNAPARAIAVENPVGCIGTRIRKADQIIQPHQFGEDASKQTCLWLKGLPKLTPTGMVAPRMVNGKPRWANQTDSGQNRLGPSEDRWAERSKTYPGIAAAMADQWGRYLEGGVQ
jgi:hypothetical protein